MGFFSNWPFSNLHNLNLDWIIEQVKKLTVVTDQIWERVKPIPGGDPSTITAAQAYNAASLAQDTADRASQSATTANTSINNHTANKNNPHEVTPQQIGAEPQIGILDVSKGGTGANNPVAARASLGARADFTILPVSDGGTGSSTPAGARDALGVNLANLGAKADFDVLPVSQGGTGATNAAGARTALGAFPSTGGTLTGVMTISVATGDAMVKCNRTDTSKGIAVGVGASGTTRGIFDTTYNNWVIGIYDDRVDFNAPGCTLSLRSNGSALLNGKQIATQ